MFKKGQRIYHEDWGYGTIKEVNHISLIVYFDKYKLSTFVRKKECKDATLSKKEELLAFGVLLLIPIAFLLIYLTDTYFK